MLALLLPVVITLIPFVIAIFLIYHFVGKKAATITSLVVGLLVLGTLLWGLFVLPLSSTKNSVTTAGEKAISEVIKADYPGAQYSVVGKAVTSSGATHGEYIIRLTGEYNEVSYTKFNKDVCMRLGDDKASLITTISKDELSPQQGMGGTCKHWLGLQ